ncbi:MAG TPA: serine hydrolase [Steroidobacteraceae bacterium]|nr:serine hydrolase [Steroidobacteraceae bacterium]
MRHVCYVLIATLVGCGGGDPGDPPRDVNPGLPATISVAPPGKGDGWMTSTPAAEGIDETRLQQALETLRGGRYPKVDSMIVARHGRLVAEGYFNGFGPETLHDLRSAGKSFVSATVGIAVEQGLFVADDPISQLIPQFDQHANMSDNKRAITVRHLLDMSSGLECDDWDTDSPGWEERMYDKRDWPGFILDLKSVYPPGVHPSYCTGGVVVLGHIVSVRSGRTLDDYAATWLLGPLDIHDVIWRRQPDGTATGGTGMRLKPRDAAKLGQLYLDGGAWNGMQVVPAAWAAESRLRATTLGGDGYGFLWWKRSFARLRGGPVDAFFAAGNGGNFVFVLPTLDLVVAFTGSNYNSDRSGQPYDILANEVLPAVN